MPIYALEEDGCYPNTVKGLKSLRPQPNWKPSDIQMASLNYARTYITDDEGSLSSLYKDLKKLMR